MNKKMLRLMYKSFDIELKQREKIKLNEAIMGAKKLQEEKEQIEKMRGLFEKSRVYSFTPHFAEMVIQRIREKEPLCHIELINEWLRSVFSRFAFVSVILLIALVTYNLILGEMLTSDELIFSSGVIFEELFNLPLF